MNTAVRHQKDLRAVRVLHVIPAIAPRYGGPSFAIRWLCQAQAELPGLLPTIATTDADGADGRLSPQQLPVRHPVEVFPRTWSERWKYAPQLGRWLKQHVASYDIVHIHSVWSYSTVVAARAARTAGVPYVIRPAGMLSRYSWGHRSVGKRLLWLGGVRKAIRHAAAVQATTDAERLDVLDADPRARVEVIPNGVPEDAWTTDSNQQLPDNLAGAFDTADPVILYLSRLHPKKGIVDLLLPALAAVRVPCRLVIAGGPDEHDPGYATKVSTTIQRLNLESRVCCVGAVQPSQRWALFDRADCFVLPSHAENFGIVVVEAMARSCPVIITEGVQLFPHVRQSGAGIVVRPEPELLTSALEQLVANSAERQRMGAAGQAYARQHFAWNQIAVATAALYQSLLSD